MFTNKQKQRIRLFSLVVLFLFLLMTQTTIAAASPQISAVASIASANGLIDLTKYSKQSFDIILLTSASVLIISMLILTIGIWPAKIMINKLRRRQTTIAWLQTTARLWAAFVGSMLALFIFRAIGMLYASDVIGCLPNCVWGFNDELIAAFNAIYLPALMALTLPIPAVWAWIKGWWKIGGRIHYTLVTLAVLALVWWAWYWNILNFQL